MPLVAFSSLPADARLWVFASDRPLVGTDADRLLADVDGYLDSWKAHGAPLRAARHWMEDRFLIVGIDPTVEQASGCSIDGLFRALQAVERVVGSRLVGGGRVFYRDAAGQPAVATRDELPALLARGAISRETPVFNTAATQLDEWRDTFERPLVDSWAAGVVDLPTG